MSKTLKTISSKLSLDFCTVLVYERWMRKLKELLKKMLKSHSRLALA